MNFGHPYGSIPCWTHWNFSCPHQQWIQLWQRSSQWSVLPWLLASLLTLTQSLCTASMMMMMMLFQVYITVIEHLCTLKWSPLVSPSTTIWLTSSPISPAPNTFPLWLCFCFVSLSWLFFNSTYGWNHTIFVFLHLTYIHLDLQGPSMLSQIAGFHSFHGWLIFQCVCVSHVFLIHLSINKSLGCFDTLVIINNAAMNTGL